MIVITLDVVMAKRKVGLMDLSHTIGITPANLSILKNEKARAIRLDTLEKLCKALDCQPGDLITYVPDENPEGSTPD